MTVNVNASALQASLEQMSQGAAAPGAQAPTQLADKFQSLMQKAPMSAPAAPQDDGTAVASKLVASQDAELQQTVNDALDLAQREIEHGHERACVDQRLHGAAAHP